MLAAELNKDTPQGPVETEAAPVEAASEPVAEATAVEVQAPATWPAEKREAFSRLPREAQEIVLERHKEMEADYTRKTMELAEQRKPLDEFSKLFDPMRQQLELAGKTPAQVTQQLLAAQRFLDTNPTEAIKWLAQSYKVDLVSLRPQDEEAYMDPAVKALRDEVTQLKSQLQNREQAVQSQNAVAAQKIITDFQATKNADGTPKYPDFKTLEPLMAVEVAKGKTLEQAYEDTSYTLPHVRERIASEAAKAAQAEAMKKAEEDRKAKAKDAKTAGSIIRSRGTAAEDDGKPLTLRQELAKNLRAIESGRI